MSKRTNAGDKKQAAKTKSPPGLLLVVAGEGDTRQSLVRAFQREGFDVQAAESGERASQLLSRASFDLVLTDIELPDAGGLDVVRCVKEKSRDTEVVVLTPNGKLDQAVQAMKGGAYDCLRKPFQPDEPLIVVHRALERRRLSQKVRLLEQSALTQDLFEGVIGGSPAMTGLLQMVRQVARLDATVLISGEPGTGKELMARLIHKLSPRQGRAFVTIDCHAIPDHLQETEIFGHPKGTEFGATSAKSGLIEEAHGGTLFLDEVGHLTPKAQIQMLRYLQNGETKRAGAPEEHSLDVRVLASTQMDLERSVEQNLFREDLYYRISVVPLHVPPLRDRIEDIPALAHHFAKLASERLGIPVPSLPHRTMSFLMSRTWERNVGELQAAIERGVAVDQDGILGLDDLPLSDPQGAEDRVLALARERSMSLSELEREYILEVLAQLGGSRKRTAERLGITTATLWRKLKQYEREHS